ncbi:hypothetical protein [Entomospira culicis]|uniref:Uncharacterized protein n=1 Tax=Entomospira culicis TaxID=2719989 RepID=A0A968GJ76_9SPIO|nr:hypothetical protein [Entomospira culicis]NIZ19823.1 hypothetical protein [Entomospira culicis]NIZ70037.1 hypothetical protein [Entomospira culicis]WDI37143.1 hypothetical protein PVA46_07430 [Entomospira culicis]WDI38772.1 hypothetical protein PVA47_07440 [Entomospira culicis]
MFKKTLFLLAVLAMIGLVSCKPNNSDVDNGMDKPDIDNGTNKPDIDNGMDKLNVDVELSVNNIIIPTTEAGEEGMATALMTLKIDGKTEQDDDNWNAINVEALNGFSFYVVGMELPSGSAYALPWNFSLNELVELLVEETDFMFTLADGVDGTITINPSSVEAFGLSWATAVTAGDTIKFPAVYKITFKGNDVDGYTVVVAKKELTDVTSTITIDK